jgi:plasmid segregation protein ParM
MCGTHQVTPKRAVSVEKVKVIPQPIGGLLDYIAQEDADIEDARVLVVDPGFFSVDWVVIAHKDLHRQSSGTSLNASSVILEEASRLIAKDHGAAVNTETLENALRAGKPTVLVLGQRVEITPYIEQAAKTVGPVVVESIQKSLRTESKMPDLVVLVGGGAQFFREALQAAFPRLTVALQDSVFSNAAVSAHGEHLVSSIRVVLTVTPANPELFAELGKVRPDYGPNASAHWQPSVLRPCPAASPSRSSRCPTVRRRTSKEKGSQLGP